MKPTLGQELPKEVRRVVAETWTQRYLIEVESELRFEKLAQRLAAAGTADSLVERARRASADEKRHAAECLEYMASYGAPAPASPPHSPREYAPGALGPRERLVYEMTTTCCIAETQSAGNLVTLFNAAPPEPLRTSLQILSRDEVTHSQLGWAYLEWAKTVGEVGFLSALLPKMLEGADRRALLAPAPPEREDPRLLQHGVLPHSQRRELFLGTLNEVILPGFERLGVDTAPARAWLAATESLS